MDDRRAPRRRVAPTGVRLLGGTLAWGVILASVGALVAAVVVPRLIGATPYSVLTGSMRPDRPPGTLVIVRPVPIDDIRVGDVVTYQLRSGRPEVVTHRVVAVGSRPVVGTILQTQGDANDVPDEEWVREAQLRGRVAYSVPYLGHVDGVLSGREHSVLVNGAALLLVGYAVVMFAGAARERTRRRRESGERVSV